MGDLPSIPASVLWIVVAVLFVGIGVLIAATPAEKHLQWDRRTGCWIYQRQLTKLGDEAKAIAAAAKFYRILGIGMAVFAAIHLVAATAMLVMNLVGPD